MLHNIDINKVKEFKGTIYELGYYLSNKNVTKYSKFGDATWELNTKPNKTKLNFINYEKQYSNNELIIFWKLYVYLLIVKKNKRNKGQLNAFNHSVRLISYLNSLKFPPIIHYHQISRDLVVNKVCASL